MRQGTVFQIVGPDGHFYIGSTTQELGVRMAVLKHHANGEANAALSHFDNYNWNGVKIEPIVTNIPRLQLKAREFEEIAKHQESPLCLNITKTTPPSLERAQRAGKVRAGARAHYLANRIKLIQQSKIWRERNPDRYRQLQLKHYEKNKVTVKNRTCKQQAVMQVNFITTLGL